uniref:Uncharacterized protein n=1 Tax=Oryza glumipatula TaxID=40148 RepID=A0A0E0BGH0_9ORYZ
MSSTSCHVFAGGGGGEFAGLLKGVGRIQDGDDEVASSAVSERKRTQAAAIWSAIWVAGDGWPSAAMSARRSRSTSSSAPRQMWCCVSCGQMARRTLFLSCADTPSTSHTRVSELSDVAFRGGARCPAARYRAASASNSATRSATRRASATTDPVSACRGPPPSPRSTPRSDPASRSSLAYAARYQRRDGGVACSSSSSSVGPGTKWIPRRPPASTRNAASAPRSARFTLPRHSIEHVVRSRRALDGARSRLFSHTACELSAQMERVCTTQGIFHEHAAEIFHCQEPYSVSSMSFIPLG